VCTSGQPDPVDADTLFQAGSVSKPVFALGAMRLVEQGRIALDGDIQQYLSSWHIPSNGEWTPRIRQRLFELLGRNGLPDSRRARRRPSKIPLVVDNPQR
jgi:CubicO group peptidase (beta-lactamase class C family)